MTPMVDVMMLLVIFFMMSTTFLIVNPGFSVTLPQASAAQDQSQQKIIILINRNGEIALNGQVITLEQLATSVASQAQQQPTAYIKADKDVSHGRVIEVMDTVRKAGVPKLSVAVETKGQ